MIFKTFNNDIDKISAKWGIFGRSFNDFFEASRNRKIAIDDLFTIEGVPLKDAKKQAGSFWSYLYPSKESIQSQIIDVDSVLPKIDENEANKILSIIKSIDDGTNEEIKSFQDLYDTGIKQNQWIAKYAQETQGQIRSVEGVTKANENARQSAIAHNNALKQQTLGAKATTVALKALSIAGNMLAGMALSLIAEGISYLASANERYIESQQKIVDSTSEKIAAYDEEISSLENLQSRLLETAGNTEQLIALQDDLNDAIGGTAMTLIDNTNAMDVYNQKIEDRIAALKRLRKEELDDNVQAQKNIYNNNEVDNDWGWDYNINRYFTQPYAANTWLRPYMELYGKKYYNSVGEIAVDYYKDAPDDMSLADYVGNYFKGIELPYEYRLPDSGEIQGYLDGQYATAKEIYLNP